MTVARGVVPRGVVGGWADLQCAADRGLRIVRGPAINATGVPTTCRHGRVFVFWPGTRASRCRKADRLTYRREPQLHKRSSRRGGSLSLGAGSWCLWPATCEGGLDQQPTDLVGVRLEPTISAKAADAVSSPTESCIAPGGVAERFKAPVATTTGTREGLEGSFPSSTTEHLSGAPLLYSDRVVQRRRAGRRRHDRPASPSPVMKPQHAAVGRWPAGLCRRDAERSAGS